jgi:hypothetical protein
MLTAADNARSYVAVSVAVVPALTVVVGMSNAVEVCPAGTVTEDGVTAAGELEDVTTTAPPAGDAESSVTTAWMGSPPVTDCGLAVNVASVGVAASVTATVRLKPYVAVITALPGGARRFRATENDALVPFAGTVTVAGTDTPAEELLSATTTPPAGAGPPSVAVATVLWLGARVAEATLSDST